MPAEAPLALGPPLRHLGEILDLILPDLPLLNWGHSSTFVLLSFPRNAPFGLPGPPEALFGLPQRLIIELKILSSNTDLG